MNLVTFGQPLWLWALALLPVCAGLYLLNSRRRREILRKVVAPRLREQLVANVSHVKRRLRFGLFLLALALLIVALARPRHGFTFEEATRKGRDIIIAIDTSRSMLANDLSPNRLTRAKLAAQDLINQLGGDRVGLIAFAGTSFLQAPLTADYSAVFNALNELDTQIIPRGGTNLASAIETAIDAFGKGESTSRALIVFTDGEELDQNAMASAAKVEGEIRIFTVGVGSAQGSVIPITNERGGTDFVRDEKGEVVKSKLDEGLLSRLAEASGGFYLRLDNGPADMARIVNQGLSGLTEQDIDERTARRPIERYQWPLAAGILLMTCALFITDRKRLRRPALAALVGASVLLARPPVYALDAVKSYEEGKYEQAYQEFEKHKKLNPESARLEYGSGTAAYKLGRFDEALAAFSKSLTTDDPALRAKSEYNIGNTLFQRGRQRDKSDAKIKEWTEALSHYEETLKLEPENADAIHNRDLVKRLIEQEQQKQEQQKKEDKEKKEEEEQKEDQAKKEEDKQDEGKQDKPKDQKGDEKSDEQEPSQDGESGEDKGQDKGEDGQPKPDDQTGENEGAPDESKKGEQKSDQSDPTEKGEPSGEGTPAPAPEQPDRDRTGELEAQPGGEPKEEEKGAEAQAMAAAEAAEEDGKMSERQAAALLRSLQGDEVSVPLNQPPVSGRVTKDW